MSGQAAPGGHARAATRAALALAALTLVVLVLAWHSGSCRSGPAGRKRDQFYTEHGQSEPTRSYTPYTGTVSYGPWGARPWAEEYQALGCYGRRAGLGRGLW